MGLSAALLAKALDLPLVATYHTDMPRLAYFLTRDHSAEELMWTFVRWFYGQCRLIFCPSKLIQEDLADHGVRGPFAPFDQAVDGEMFSPSHRSEELHSQMGGGGPELSAIYASADLFVFPGLADTFGQVVLEAAASGLPAVVSAGVAVDEIIERGQTALTVAPGDAEGFAAAMETLLDDDPRRRRMGDAARRRALTRSWDVTFDGVWDAYRTLTP